MAITDPSASGCIVLVVPLQSERALIGAELIERGYDVVGMRGLRELLAFHPAAAGHGCVSAVLIDRKALAGRHRRPVAVLRDRYPGVPFALLSGTAAALPGDDWNAVIARPASAAHIAGKIEELLATAPVRERLAAQLH